MADIPFDINQQHYTEYFAFKGKSAWRSRIWKEAFGEQYPEGLDHYGYLTKHELKKITSWIKGKEGSTLVDIGCGKGGPGLWLAEQNGLRLVGIDPIPGAIDQARRFQLEFSLEFPAQFTEGHFCDIPVEDKSLDIALSIDSLWPVYDKIAALMEVNRVLRKGGQFILSNWDLIGNDPVPAFEYAGFRLVDKEVSLKWRIFQEAVYEGIGRYKDELVQDMGAAANIMLHEASTSRDHLSDSMRLLYYLEKK
jgi:SAM-dependent methyltransferase